MSKQQRSRRWWHRARVPVVIIPLLAGLAIAGSIGASMLWATVPEPEAAPRLATCWNKVERPAAQCTEPRGTAGLEYVFPGFVSTDDTCIQHVNGTGSRRVLEWRCTTSLRGRDVEISYRQRPSLERGLRYLQKRYAEADRQISDDGSRIVWRPAGRDPSGRFVFVAAYQDYPFSVTVRASTPQLRDEATRTLVHFRAPDRIKVRPAAAG